MMETALVFAASLVIGFGIAAFVFLVVRPRAPIPDPAIAERMIELNTRVQQMGELLAKAQSQLQHTVNERLDAVTKGLGESMQISTKHTGEHLTKLNERLAVIDSAQKNITDLASHVTSLRDVLANKQARGAFGQGRMESIIQDGLPKGAYEFQFTLKNGKRPDCVVLLPDQHPLVIDAARVRQDVTRHITDIAEKYLIPGETQDTALMFVPSESVYAELHDGFDDIVQKGYRAQVMLVSPTLLMLAIQVIQQIQKDSQMRQAADQIRTEVGVMMKDVRLLSERVRKLQTHFGQAGEDINNILTSTSRIEKRATKIEELEFDENDDASVSNVIAAPMRKLEAGE